MTGHNVLQPMGWDAFGLPAENAAIKNKTAPAKWTYENIDHMREPAQVAGLCHRLVARIRHLRAGLLRARAAHVHPPAAQGPGLSQGPVVNWDPVDQTVLANEQVIDGRGWRSGALVEKREIPQWFLRITDYAQELLDGLDELDGWPESVKTMQRNWIGRSRRPGRSSSTSQATAASGR